MVSRNGRKESVRQNGAHRRHAGGRVGARRGIDRGRLPGHSAGPSAGYSVVEGGDDSFGALGVLVESGDEAALGRPHFAPNPPALGPSVIKNLFIAGTPGVGKTTLLREVTLSRRQRIGGFYTEHILSGRLRKGFLMRTFDGQERVLAAKGLKSPHQLGKYGVDLNALENVGVPALKLALMSKDVIVIDEIGSMEMMSERFRQAMLECLTSTKPVLATIRAASQPFSDQVKKFADTQTLVLTKANYPSVKQQVRKWLDSHL